MSDATAAQAQPGSTAGAMLRAARETAGLHIGVLAATLKVPVRKLELLESDRYEDLPDATFVRALSLSVCRVLKCDPVPVLAALPRQEGVASTLEQVTKGMNAPLSGRAAPGTIIRASSQRWWWWVAALTAALAAAVAWAPELGHGSLAVFAPSSASRPPAGAASSPAGGVTPAAGATVTSAPALMASAPAASAPTGMVQTVHGTPSDTGVAAAGPMASSISVTEPSWIEALDLQGRQIWARTLTPGEVVALEGGGSLRLTIGNAAGTQVRWRGQLVDLTAVTRDNVARLELK